MSVMLISYAQLDALTSWAALCAPAAPAHVGGHWVTFGAERVAIARALHQENAAAFTDRYAEAVDCSTYLPTLNRAAAALSVGQVYELLASYEYNAEDSPTWSDSDARSHCRQLREALCKHLPGRKACAWTIDSPADVARLATVASASSRAPLRA